MAVEIGSGSITSGGRVEVQTSTGGRYAVMVNSGILEVQYSSDGSSWAVKDAGNSPNQDHIEEAVVGIDSSNILHILYSYYDTEPYPDASRLFYITFDTSNDTYGASETPGINIDVHYTSPGIAIDSDDIPHIVYSIPQSTKPAYDTVRYQNRTGGEWQDSVEIEGSTNSKDCIQCDIAINASDIPVITYFNNSDNDVATALGNQNNATSFTLKDVDTNVEGLQARPSICVDGSGDTWIAYVDRDDTIDIAKQSVNWTDNWTIASDGDTGSAPSIVANSTDIYVFYENADSDIVYNKYTGTWAGETVLETGSFTTAKAKWSYLFNNQGSLHIDYLFEGQGNIYWNTLVLEVVPTVDYSWIYPIIGIGARGAFNNLFIFQQYGKDRVIKRYYYPYNPQTVDQQAHRALFANAVSYWQGFDDNTKGFYNATVINKPLSGYNRYISLYLEANKA